MSLSLIIETSCRAPSHIALPAHMFRGSFSRQSLSQASCFKVTIIEDASLLGPTHLRYCSKADKSHFPVLSVMLSDVEFHRKALLVQGKGEKCKGEGGGFVWHSGQSWQVMSSCGIYISTSKIQGSQELRDSPIPPADAGTNFGGL